MLNPFEGRACARPAGRRRRRFLRRFLRRRDGAAALEFAIVAPPFFTLLLGMFEIAAAFFAEDVLQSAVNEMARQIRTGQVAAQGMTEQRFREEICNRIDFMLRCDTQLAIDVRRFDNFNSAAFGNPLNGQGEFNDNFQFQPGAPGDTVLVRAFYSWDIMTPMFGPMLGNMGAGDRRLIQASAAFRNEPFGEILP